MPLPDEVIRPYPRPASTRLVSYSELSTMDCWLKHHYAYTMGLRPVTTWVGLRLGRAWDVFLNVWHEPVADGALPLHHEARLENGLRAAGEAIEREAWEVDAALMDKGLGLPEDWHAQLDAIRTTIVGMAYHYAARWGDEDDAEWRTLAVQLRFEVPFPSATGKRRSTRYWLHGVIDRVAEHVPTGRVFVVDAKLRDGAVDLAYREGFDHDPQLKLYGWALRQLPVPYADRVVGGAIDAASTALPTFPALKAQPEPVPSGEFDADGKSIPLTEPVPCPACDGIGQTGVGDDVVPTEECAKCDGEGVARFASGARKGEVKTVAVKRPALYADAECTTVLPVYLAALDAHGLPREQYDAEVAMLAHEWAGHVDSRFHWRTSPLESLYTAGELERAIGNLVGIAPYLDSLPPVPMPGRMKCRWCNFRDICPSPEVDALSGFTTREQRRQPPTAPVATEPDPIVPALAPV